MKKTFNGILFIFLSVISLATMFSIRTSLKSVDQFRKRSSEIENVFTLRRNDLIYKDGESYKIADFNNVVLKERQDLLNVAGSDFAKIIRETNGNLFIAGESYNRLDGLGKVIANYILFLGGTKPLDSKEYLEKGLNEHIDLLEATETQEGVDKLFLLTTPMKILINMIIGFLLSIVVFVVYTWSKSDELFLSMYIMLMLENFFIYNLSSTPSFFIIAVFLFMNTVIYFTINKLMSKENLAVKTFENSL